MRTVLILLSFLCGFSLAEKTCGTNEEFTESGFECQPRICTGSEVGPCTLINTPGCKCKSGFVRDSDRNCVADVPCDPQVCNSANKTHYNCIPKCGPTCDREEMEICTLDCITGCYCKEGYLLNRLNECVLPTDCAASVAQTNSPSMEQHRIERSATEQCTGENEQYTSCGTSCPLTCWSPTTPICNRMCVAGCFCKRGYLRDNDNKCVLPENCQCNGANEEFSNKSSECHGTCGDPIPFCMNRFQRFAPGCSCKEDHVRYNNSHCVPAMECPPQECSMGEHEHWNTSCTLPMRCQKCDSSANCTAPYCAPGCACDEGYKRNKSYKCVLVAECNTNSSEES